MGKGFEKEPIRRLRQHIFRRIILQAVWRRNPVFFPRLRRPSAGLSDHQICEGRREHATRRRRHKTFCAIFSRQLVILCGNYLSDSIKHTFSPRIARRCAARGWRAPISVSRIQLVSGRVPTVLASPGPPPAASRANQEQGWEDRAAAPAGSVNSRPGLRTRLRGLRRVPPDSPSTAHAN